MTTHRAVLAFIVCVTCSSLIACNRSDAAPKGETSSASASSKAGAPLNLGTFEQDLSTASGASWVAVNDKVAGGISTAEIAVVDDGAAGTKKALSIKGKVELKEFPFPYAGAGLALAPDADKKPKPLDISQYQGLQFWAKGDGKQYYVRLMSTDVHDYNHHHYVFRATNEWTLHRVQFSQLVQFKWGQQIPWTGKNVAQVSFTNYSAPGDPPGDISLFIDELSLF